MSIRDVALRAEVSVGTVSKYLNSPHRVAPETQKRIRKAIASLGYVRNEAARQLRAGASRVIAFVALELNNPFFGDVADSIERRAAEHGLYLHIASSSGDAEREARYIEMFVQQRVYGMILSSGLTRQSELDLLATRRTPTVLVDAYPRSQQFSSTSVDDVLGARWAVEHLIEQGCRSIAFVGGDGHIHQIAQRAHGAALAVEAHTGVRLEVIPSSERSVAAGARIATEIAERSAADRPDGIFAANDSLAIGLLQAFTSSGALRVPEDIAIVGYDDIDYAATASVPLSTVRRPSEAFGRSAVELLRDQAEDPEHFAVRNTVIQPELVVRRSSLRG